MEATVLLSVSLSIDNFENVDADCSLIRIVVGIRNDAGTHLKAVTVV